MPRHTNAVAWDADVLISWISDENRADPTETDGIVECIHAVQSGKLRLVFAEIISLEVLEGTMPRDSQAKLSNLLRRRNVQVLPETPRVRELAKDIREFYVRDNRADRKGSVGLGDALHLANAIHYGIPTFYTFDGGKKGRTRSLLSLNGNVAGHKLESVRL